MTTGKIVNLCVRPLHGANLAFDTGGIIGERTVELGKTVTAFDYASFYANLGATVSGNAAQLQFDSQAIHNAAAVAASNLLALRAESLKALLDKAIRIRANAYYATYGNSSAIVAQAKQSYSPGIAGSKPNLLADLQVLAAKRDNLIQAAYSADNRTGVVKVTTSSLSSQTYSEGLSNATDTIDETSSPSLTTSTSERSQGGDVSGPIVGFQGQVPIMSPTQADNTGQVVGIGSTTTGTDRVTGTADTGTTALGFAVQNQTIVNTGYDYRVPSIESSAQTDRAQISLIDEGFAQFLAGQSLPYLQQMFDNELGMIDLDVRRLQIAYLNTILLSPIDGIVTGVFKELGDGVGAGDVVVRVENPAQVLLEGTIVCRQAVKLGSIATVHTTRYGDPSSTTTISGTVVAAQGHSCEDDWWNISVNASNLDGNGDLVFPLQYHFDYDDTTITIS